MSENISVTFKGSAQNLFDDTLNEIKTHGGTITGDTNHGSFKIPVLFSSPATGHLCCFGTDCEYLHYP